MKTTKNIARLAITAGLTAALSFGGVMAPVTMAFADGTPVATTNGNVTIKDGDYAGTTFKGIKIFSATVTQDQTGADVWDSTDEKTLSDIKWVSGNVKDAVMSVFDGDGYVNKPENDDAQAWAEFIKEQAGSDNVGVGAKVNADNKLNVIAEKLINTKGLEWTDLANQQTKNLGAGYWLFVTNQPGSTKDTNKTNGNDDAFTSPIFTIVGGADVNAEPKKSVPNVTKAVKDDKDGTFGTDVFKSPNKSADSRMDQFIEYQLTGTVASNINTYSAYTYTFTDELPKSMTPKFTDEASSTTPAVTVKIDGKKVISGYTATFDGNNVLTVDFGDLKVCKGENNSDIAVTGNSTVTVEYQAKLDPAKIFVNGKDGAINPQFGSLVGNPQENTVTLTYSNNPHAEGTGTTGTTVKHPAYDYTYGIDVTKVGSETDNPPLAGVVFTLQEQGDADGTFIMANGIKTTDGKLAELTTDAKGKINIVGLDEGTYILKEVTPAPGYNNSAANGVTFTIKSTFDQTGKNVKLDTSTIDAGKDVVMGGTATAGAGKLSFTIVDKKGSNLPLTGLNGVTFTWIAGGAVLCIGVAHLIRSRKRDDGSEE